MFEAHQLQHKITSGYIQVVSDGHQLPAFWAHPELGGPFAGLVLLHDYWGLTPHIRSQARRFAGQGYYVIVPDLFNKQTPDTAARAEALVKQLGATAHSHVSAAINALRTHHRCNDDIGLIGWGFGGELALQAGVVHDHLDAIVSFYGLPLELSPAELRALPCPLLLLLAGRDLTTPPERIAAVQATLATMPDSTGAIVYDDADHGFFNDARATFHATAAEDAWARTLAFLRQTLRSSTSDSAPTSPAADADSSDSPVPPEA